MARVEFGFRAPRRGEKTTADASVALRTPPPDPSSTKVDLWPEDFGQAPWQQEGGTGGGSACTAFAVGGAAYWTLRHDDPSRDPGTPDFPFLYNNEAFVTSSIVRLYATLSKGGEAKAPTGFHIEAAARSAAIFGVRFLPEGQDYTKLPFTFSPAPPYESFAQARRNLFAFHQPFKAPPVDPNAPVLVKVAKVPRHPAIRRQLLGQRPVVVGLTLYENLGFSKKGDLPPLASPRGDVVGAHAVLITGYDDATRRFRFRNSWGTEWGDGGYGTLPYDWVDDTSATYAFTTLSFATRSLRPFVPFDTVRIENQRASGIHVGIDAYDGRCAYLGGMTCDVAAGRKAVVHPVRWLDTYRLDVCVTPAAGADGVPTGVQLMVDDADGAVASGAEIVVPSRASKSPTGTFLGHGERRLGTWRRATVPAMRLQPPPPPPA